MIDDNDVIEDELEKLSDKGIHLKDYDLNRDAYYMAKIRSRNMTIFYMAVIILFMFIMLAILSGMNVVYMETLSKFLP